MIVWDASKVIRRSWRQNASLTTKGEDCGLVIGSVHEFYNILLQSNDIDFFVIMSEYCSDIKVESERFNRFYTRTQVDLINNYIKSKKQLANLLTCLGASVYYSADLNNYLTCKCLLQVLNPKSAIIYSEFDEFAAFESEAYKVVVQQEYSEFLSVLYMSIFGNYFLEKTTRIRPKTIGSVVNFKDKNLSVEDFFSLIINGNLNFKQKHGIAEIREKVESNYRVLTVMTEEERYQFLSCYHYRGERNKTRFKLLNKKFGYKFSEDFIDNLFIELNRISAVVDNGK